MYGLPGYIWNVRSCAPSLSALANNAIKMVYTYAILYVNPGAADPPNATARTGYTFSLIFQLISQKYHFYCASDSLTTTTTDTPSSEQLALIQFILNTHFLVDARCGSVEVWMVVVVVARAVDVDGRRLCQCLVWSGYPTERAVAVVARCHSMSAHFEKILRRARRSPARDLVSLGALYVWSMIDGSQAGCQTIHPAGLI